MSNIIKTVLRLAPLPLSPRISSSDVPEPLVPTLPTLPDFASQGITDPWAIHLELLKGRSLLVKVGKTLNLTIFTPPTRLLLFYSPALPELVEVDWAREGLLVLNLPSYNSETFAHLLSWLQNFNKDVSVVPLHTFIGTAALKGKCTLLARIYCIAVYLDIAAVQHRVLHDLSIATRRARELGFHTPISAETIAEVFEELWTDDPLWKLLIVEMCKAFTGRCRPTYEDYTVCFAIEEFRRPVMNAVANRIMDGPGATFASSNHDEETHEDEIEGAVALKNEASLCNRRD